MLFEIKSADLMQSIWVNPSFCTVLIPSVLAQGDGKCRVFVGPLNIEVTPEVAQAVVAAAKSMETPVADLCAARGN